MKKIIAISILTMFVLACALSPTAAPTSVPTLAASTTGPDQNQIGTFVAQTLQAQQPTAEVIASSTTPPFGQPTPVPFGISQWRGTFRWFGSLNPVNFLIQHINGSSFSGAMYWQFTQCRVAERVEGDIIQDISSASEQNRWALHPDFQSGDKSGTWLRWTQNEDISGTICYLTISGDWWYAHINSAGHMVGIHFTNATNIVPDSGATFDFTLLSP